MVAFKGHFDGKVIVPDEPLDIQPNERLMVRVERIEERRIDYRDWIGLGNRFPQNPSPRFQSDASLWE